MKITLKGNELELTDEQVKEIVDKYKTEDTGVFRPKIGELYYYTNDSGHLRFTTWEYCILDQLRLRIGNVYRTEDELEHALEVQKALTRIRSDAPNWKPDWKDVCEKKYYVFYDCSKRKFNWDYCIENIITVLPYYQTQERVQQAIKDHEADYKIVFGVE